MNDFKSSLALEMKSFLERNMDFSLVLQSDIEAFFLNNINTSFISEYDLQSRLGSFLRTKGHEVHMEYYVPVATLKLVMNEDEKWERDFYIDLVVQHEGQYIPIELKYKTKNFGNSITTERFGVNLDVGVFKNHGAHNQNLYLFWKDVRRLELLKKRFSNITCGFAIFLTNDAIYWQSKSGARELFSMENKKIHNKEKAWRNEPKLESKNPNFTVEKAYQTLWIPEDISGESFRYCLLKI